MWGNKPPKFRREIVEATTIEGGLKLHNLKKFDAALKIGWLKGYVRTKSKWTTTPIFLEFDGLFKFGKDYIERLLEMTFNPFWLDVLKSLKSLWSDDRIIVSENILQTPLWYNNKLMLQIKREWILKGIYTINDLLDANGSLLTLKCFERKYGLVSIFLDYGVVCLKQEIRSNFSFMINTYRVPANIGSYLQGLLWLPKREALFRRSFPNGKASRRPYAKAY